LAFEVGEYEEKKPGRRVDLEALAQSASSGATMKELADANPVAVIQYGAGIQRLLTLYEKPRDFKEPKICVCYYGPTHCGKSWTAFTEAPDAYVWDPGMEKWFDGYSGQKNVIMEEFRGQLPMGFILRLLDRYPMRVQVKGGSAQFQADKIILTSPKHPKDWYQDNGDDKIAQLLDRFQRHPLSRIVHLDVPYEES